MAQVKTFYTKAESDAFMATLPPCRYTNRTFGKGVITLKWEPLRLATGSVSYPIQREVEHAYLMRDEVGTMIKVNRYTLMGSDGRHYSLE